MEEKEATKQERRDHEELKGKLDERREGGPASSSPESARIKTRQLESALITLAVIVASKMSNS